MIEIKRTANSCPPRMILHGGEKVGKSTFCNQSFRPIFLPTEEGLKGIDALKAVPQGKDRLETFEEFQDALRFVEGNLQHFDTVIIDSADWLEMLIFDKICRASGKKTIAEANGGYGKGYLAALDLWQSTLLWLDRINRMGKWIILICHSKSTPFNDPYLAEPYDVWTMKLHSPKGQNGSLELLKEWADVIAFAAVERFVNETATSKAIDKGNKVFKAMETGRRILHFEPTQAFLAGNRYSLKGDCDLTWQAFMGKFQQAFQAK